MSIRRTSSSSFANRAGLVFQDRLADGGGGGAGVAQSAQPVQVLRLPAETRRRPPGSAMVIAPSCSSQALRKSIAWSIRTT